MPAPNQILIPPVPPYSSKYVEPRFNPTFDGQYAHGLTTNPYLNQLFEATNLADYNISVFSQMNNRGGGGFPPPGFPPPGYSYPPVAEGQVGANTTQEQQQVNDPNISYYNNNVAPGLSDASAIYRNAMNSTSPPAEA